MDFFCEGPRNLTMENSATFRPSFKTNKFEISDLNNLTLYQQRWCNDFEDLVNSAILRRCTTSSNSTAKDMAEWQGNPQNSCFPPDPSELNFTTIFSEWFNQSSNYNFTDQTCKLNSNISDCDNCLNYLEVKRKFAFLNLKKVKFPAFQR